MSIAFRRDRKRNVAGVAWGARGAWVAWAAMLWCSVPAAFGQPERGADCRPSTGCVVPALQAIDDAMRQFMCANGISAGVLGMMKDGVVVLERGYGWQDEARTSPLPHNAMMRIASVSKPLTAAAARVLIADGALSLNTFAFDLGQPGGGVLDERPFPALGDARLANVTISHLLNHRGGWDRDLAGDLTYMEVAIASAMGVTSPPGRSNTVRHILGQPLQHAPGAASRYSNVGYLVLGLIVERVSGMGLEAFIRERVLSPIGVRDSEFALGRTFAADQNPREPWYDHNALMGVNVFDPAGRRVRRPYGGWDHEARAGQGAHITATRTLLRLLQARYISGENLIGLPRTGNEAPTWRRNHTGSLAGTNALARQRGDGVNFVVIFNRRPSAGTDYASQMLGIIDGILDNAAIAWPTAEPCSPGDVNVDGRVNVTDLLAVIGAWGPCPTPEAACLEDVTGDCSVNVSDLLLVIGNWG